MKKRITNLGKFCSFKLFDQYFCLDQIKVVLQKDFLYPPVSEKIKFHFEKYNQEKQSLGMSPDYDGILAAPISIVSNPFNLEITVIPFSYCIHALRQCNDKTSRENSWKFINDNKQNLIAHKEVQRDFWPFVLGVECLPITTDNHLLLCKRSMNSLTSKGALSNACAGYYEFNGFQNEIPDIISILMNELKEELNFEKSNFTEFRPLGYVISNDTFTTDIIVLGKLCISSTDLEIYISDNSEFFENDLHQFVVPIDVLQTPFEQLSLLINENDFRVTHTLLFALQWLKVSQNEI